MSVELGSSDPNVWVIIPARGGSKGIVGKNLQVVGGRTLLCRSVEAARRASCPSIVAVTTDDDAIAVEAAAYGAEVIRRPDELATDEASSESALLHALDELERARGMTPDVVVFVQCTSPFLTAGDIDGTVALIVAGYDSAFTGTPNHGFIWRSDGETAVGVNHASATRERRQDRPVEHLEVGSVYAMRADGFRESGHRFFGRIGVLEVDASRAIEIDEPADLEQARLLAPLHDRAAALDRLPRRVAALVLDFDGVVTDNQVLTTEDGTEAVVTSRSDGMGIELLRSAGVPVVVMSKERNPVVAARCAKLGIEAIQGLEDKGTTLRRWCSSHGFALVDVVFVGNDVNDQACLHAAGCGAVVADAHPSVVADANLVLTSAGGHGAVREICDLIIERNRSASS